MTSESKRRYTAWAISFRRRLGSNFDPDLFLAVAKDAAKVVELPPVTVTDAARFLGIPGSTPAGKAQKLRRLEREGRLPPARRSLVTNARYWLPEELVETVAKAAVRAAA